MLSFRLHLGDCRELMATMPEASVDAIVTDPPYGIGFMGKEWDTFNPATVAKEKLRDTRGQKRRNLYAGKESDAPSAAMAAGRYDFAAAPNRKFQAWVESWAVEALRVLKPGGHLLCSGGCRTFHRLTCGLEDAGFEIRDCLSWLFGSGFPKSLDVSKAIDKAAGAVRETFGVSPNWRETKRDNGQSMNPMPNASQITFAATDAARNWSGWGTALKPAWEPIVLARKPLTGTVAANVQGHGTGALNIDACRIEGADGDGHWSADDGSDATSKPGYDGGFTRGGGKSQSGRWPANVLLDEEAAAMLDEQSGELASGANPERRGTDQCRGVYAGFEGQKECNPARGADSGGASRFFYSSKASRAEREDGLARDQKASHPTVKPVDLMGWLCRLVTRPRGVILDPFTGSGSTGVAAIAGGFNFIGCEIEPEYLAIARARIGATAPLLAREETVQADGSRKGGKR